MRFPHPDAVATVVIKCRAYVPSVEGVGGPTGALVGFGVDKHTCSWWGDGGAVEVERALGPGRQFWV